MSMEKIYVSGYWRNAGDEYTIPVYHAAIVDKQIEELVELLLRIDNRYYMTLDRELLKEIDAVLEKVRG